MRNTHRIEVLLLFPVLFSVVAACGGGMANVDGDIHADGPAVACADPPGALAPPSGAPGDILRCGKLDELDVPAFEARSRAFLGDATRRAYTSGARIYRVLYRTTRATVPASAGVASALVYLPTVPRAARVPVVVATHGAFGAAPNCAPSHLIGDPDHGGLYQTLVSQVHPLVGAGYAVIAPDLSGFAGHGAAGNPRPALLSSEDEAYAVLDASRALRYLVPDKLTPDVVLTGQSAGAHATLSALAYADSYGAGGPTWNARFAADYPHLPAPAARVPTLLAYGDKDEYLVPPLMQCAVNRLAADGVKPTVCIDPHATHGGATGIAATRGDYAADWIANLTLGAPAPAACSVAAFDPGVTCPLPPQ